jgi:hypothetical protein
MSRHVQGPVSHKALTSSSVRPPCPAPGPKGRHTRSRSARHLAVRLTSPRAAHSSTMCRRTGGGSRSTDAAVSSGPAASRGAWVVGTPLTDPRGSSAAHTASDFCRKCRGGHDETHCDEGVTRPSTHDGSPHQTRPQTRTRTTTASGSANAKPAEGAPVASTAADARESGRCTGSATPGACNKRTTNASTVVERPARGSCVSVLGTHVRGTGAGLPPGPAPEACAPRPRRGGRPWGEQMGAWQRAVWGPGRLRQRHHHPCR